MYIAHFKENDIKDEQQNREGMSNNHTHLNGLQLTKEECRVLEHLKRKREAENKKYERLYPNKS